MFPIFFATTPKFFLQIPIYFPVSSEPTNVQCQPQSFDEIRITWDPPTNLNTAQVQYQVGYAGSSQPITANQRNFTKFTKQTLLYEVLLFLLVLFVSGADL